MAELNASKRLRILIRQLKADMQRRQLSDRLQLPGVAPCSSQLQPVVPESVGLCSERLKHVDAFVRSIVDKGEAPMAAVGVLRHGQLAHFCMTGHRHEEQGLPVAEDTIYRMYSMTKPVVSVALLMLYEEGRFESFDAPLSKYIPCFKDMQVYVSGDGPDDLKTRPAKSQITIKDLLVHTSGIGYGFVSDIPAVSKMYQDAVSFLHTSEPFQPYDLAEACRRLSRVPLLCDPGTEWHYGMSTDVVGRLVEVLSGQSLGEFLQTRIFGPLDMNETGFVVPAEKVHRLAALYAFMQPESGQKPYVRIEDPTNSAWLQPRDKGLVSGGAGLASTIPDWLKWTGFLLRKGTTEHGKQLLGPKTFAYASVNHLPHGQCLDVVGAKATNPPNVVYKKGQGWCLLGLSVMEDPARYDAVCSKGELAWGSVGSGYLWVDHDEDLAVIFKTQLMPSSAYPWRRHLHGLVYQALKN